jgi:ubiquinone/menaquinone biosynthesis C-methylase UbiE
MSDDHYAGAAHGWAHGATLVYAPIARALVATAPHPLAGRLVLDVGAGTGVASTVLGQSGAVQVALDRSFDMLAWDAGRRPPSAMADVQQLPLRDGAVDDTVAAFVFNHLVEPVIGIAETVRVTRPGGAVLACVYANTNRSEVRDAIDRAAQAQGWQAPDWYAELKRSATPLLGTAEDMARVAAQAGLVDVVVDERPAEVGVTEPEQLVDYRLGQANYSAWLNELDPERAKTIRSHLVEVIRPIMRPYRPIVVFLSAIVPTR